MKREMYTLTNSFHGTECQTTYSPADRERIDYLIGTGRMTSIDAGYRARRRAWKALCGNSACRCGNAWGER